MQGEVRSGPGRHRYGLAGATAHMFIDSKLTPLVVFASLMLGAMAALLIPREEEPQIIVPMVDIFVQMPGASAEEVEQRVTKPMEKLLWEIPGVEYIYTTSSSGQCMAIVRFRVGQDEEDSLVRLCNKLYSNYDLIPPGCSEPLVKLRSIDDVPVLALTLWTDAPYYERGGQVLRRVAAQLEDDLKEVPDVSSTRIIGGDRRQICVRADRVRLAGHGVDLDRLIQALRGANRELPSGSFSAQDYRFQVDTGEFLKSAADVESVVVTVGPGGPVYVRDVADVSDTGEEPSSYVYFGLGPRSEEKGVRPIGYDRTFDAVTISVAKRKGTNAATVAHQVLRKVKTLRGAAYPSDVHITVTRNYGETALEKANELLKHLLIATLSVAVLIAFALGVREAGVVLVAVPVTLALTLMVFFLYRYTLNRVTLFALIFSIGILVDDAIVVVENIVRHFRLPENRGRAASQIAVDAVAEVGNPTILATFTVIAAILPLAFVRGLMGPYMRPIPVGASAAMIFSLVIAFVISPWASIRLLRRQGRGGHEGEREGRATRLYRRVMGALVHRRGVRWGFLIGVVVLLGLAVSMLFVKLVKVKMLPFDNKSEFQIIVDMPEGSTLEQTSALCRQLGNYVSGVPEVTDYQCYVGTSGPFNFNGLVRHYFLRSAANEADIQVNLVDRHHRKAQSHDIAKRVRPDLVRLAQPYGARIKVAEVPPGPPVLQTMVAEIYGPDMRRQREIAAQILSVFEKTPGVVDADWYVEETMRTVDGKARLVPGPQTKYRFMVDKEKAAYHGITGEQIAGTLNAALHGAVVGLAHIPDEKEDVDICVRLPESQRSSVDDLRQIQIASRSGELVPLGELARVQVTEGDEAIYHKNLQPVVYVTADLAGVIESPVYAILKMNRTIDRMKLPEGYRLKRYTTHQPFSTARYSMKWDGEWHITYEVFRDMGLAFAVVLVLIYVLVVGWFQSFWKPIVILAAIPFSLVGILPAHWAMGAFFTATSMIGFIAGAGIVVRNSIILVDFIELRLQQGSHLDQAVIDAGAIRFRPMLLTAAAVVVGSAVILFDPIFQGLAIALMAGEVASLLLSRMTVPVLYFMAEARALRRSGQADRITAIGPSAVEGSRDAAQQPIVGSAFGPDVSDPLSTSGEEGSDDTPV